MDNSSVRRVRMVNNRPSLLLDGEDTLPLIYALSDFPGADSRTFPMCWTQIPTRSAVVRTRASACWRTAKSYALHQ